jgi:hypothetical protein
MFKRLVLMFALSFAIATFSFSAFAFSPSAPKLGDNNIIQVRDGCGPGWHWSFRWHTCVRNYGYYPRWRRRWHRWHHWY